MNSKTTIIAISATLALVAMPTIAEKTSDAIVDWNGAMLVGSLGRDCPFFAPGEEMVFAIHLEGAAGDMPPDTYYVDWERRGDDGIVDKGRAPLPTADAPLVVRTKSDKPGFVCVEANVVTADGRRVPKNHRWEKRVFFQGGAAVSPETLRPGTEPADYDAFWAGQLARLAEVPIRAELSQTPCDDTSVRLYAVRIACAGPRPATGWLTMPADASPEKRYPLVVNYLGAGMGDHSIPAKPPHDRIRLECNGHGFELGRGPEYVKEFFASVCKPGYEYGFDPDTNEHRETSYWLGMALRAVRALQWAATIPEWDGKTLELNAGSQGGYQALFAGACCPVATKITTGIVWGCDWTGQSEYGRLRSTYRPKCWYPDMAYFDAVFAAARVKCPVEITAGLGDYVSPPSSLAVLYNSLQVPKKIRWMQGWTHGWNPPGMAAWTVDGGFDAALRKPALQWKCGPNARIEGDLLIVDVPVGEEKTGGLATADLDITAWDGKPIGASIVASGERIAKPLHWYTGLKFQFEYEDPLSGEWSYPNTPGRLGAFPKQTIRVADLVAGTSRAKACMMIGLQETSGHAVFDLSTLRIGDPVPLWPITNQSHRCAYTEAVEWLPPITNLMPRSGNLKAHRADLTPTGRLNASARRRGVMSPSQAMTLDDFDTLQSWGATLIRYQMGRNWNAQKVTPDLGEYDRWLDTRLDHFDSFVLPQAVKRGMKVVLDMHEVPGMKNEFNEWNMLHDPAVAKHFVETWQRIARRFKGRAGIYGYDLWNEPMQTGKTAPGCDFWTLQKRAAEAIREIDAEIPIIVECNGQDSPWAYGCFSPLDLTNIIYQVHMYLPLAYTHQGVMWKQGDSYRPYPDESKGWNKDYLRAGLRPVREFQLRHGAKIYCGEFSAVAWAPGADQYLRDCIDIFEEYGWDWSYHAFREWEGWSVEYEGPNWRGLVPAADSARKRALVDGLRRR